MNLSKLGSIFGLILKKNTPKLLTVGGAALVVVGVISAVKATPKALAIKVAKDEDLANIKDIKTGIESGEVVLAEGKTYTEDEYNRDLAITYGTYYKKQIINYLPSGLIVAAGIACMAASSIVLKKRNLALSTGLAALNAAYMRQQDNIKAMLGQNDAQELKYETISTTETPPGKNAKPIEYKQLNKLIVGEVSPYAKFFDENSRYFFHNDDGNERNIAFLKKQQCYANDRLKKQGYLFLNDVYELLDIPTTQIGSVVGWVYDRNDESTLIDFDLYNITRDGNRRFVNGDADAVLLDFNVTGKIARYI